MLIACEQTLHYLRESRDVTRKQHAKGDASARGGEKRVSLQRSLINFHSAPETFAARSQANMLVTKLGSQMKPPRSTFANFTI